MLLPNSSLQFITYDLEFLKLFRTWHKKQIEQKHLRAQELTCARLHCGRIPHFLDGAVRVPVGVVTPLEHVPVGALVPGELLPIPGPATCRGRWRLYRAGQQLAVFECRQVPLLVGLAIVELFFFSSGGKAPAWFRAPEKKKHSNEWKK